MRAILFDMDGVLVDVSLSYRLAIKRTVGYFTGRRVSFSQIQEYKNRGGLNNDWDLTEIMLKEYGKRIEQKRIIEVFQEIYLGENFDGLIRNERWLLDVKILEIIDKDFKLGIVTGRSRMEACYTLKRFNVERYFPVLVAMDNLPLGKAKPDPFGIKLALMQLGSTKAYYIGDTIDDMIAARRANVVPIAVARMSAGCEKQKGLLHNSGARWVLGDINNILEVLE